MTLTIITVSLSPYYTYALSIAEASSNDTCGALGIDDPQRAITVTIKVMFVPKYAYQVLGNRRKLLETNKLSINKPLGINSVFPPLISLFEEK